MTKYRSAFVETEGASRSLPAGQGPTNTLTAIVASQAPGAQAELRRNSQSHKRVMARHIDEAVRQGRLRGMWESLLKGEFSGTVFMAKEGLRRKGCNIRRKPGRTS